MHSSEPHPDLPLYLGIDVGGTNIKLGLVDSSGKIVAKSAAITDQLRTPEKVFRQAVQFVDETCRIEKIPSGSVAAVGMAVPGVLDTRKGVLREVVNLPEWIDRPLCEILEDETGWPCAVVNDANAAAYAEHCNRNLGDQSLALVTLGTGIGCGIVAGGRPYGGDHGCAGELGHIAVDFEPDAILCTCGSRGHLESYAGAFGVVTRLRSKISSLDRETLPAVLFSNQLSPRDIASEAESGNSLCLEIVDETATFIGHAIGMVGQVLDPAVVLMGGAMNFGANNSKTGRRFIERVRRAIVDTTLVQVGQNMLVEFASLGNDAGMLGAALVAKQSLKNE